jgi:hypothetical protein
MGYLFHNFWFSKRNCVAIWADQLALLTSVQVPHGDQPQIQPGSLKLSEITCALVHLSMKGGFIERPCFKFNGVPNVSKIQLNIEFS